MVHLDHLAPSDLQGPLVLQEQTVFLVPPGQLVQPDLRALVDLLGPPGQTVQQDRPVPL